MLLSHSRAGDYPLEAVRIMRKVCQEAERVDSMADYPIVFAALVKSTPKSLTDGQSAHEKAK